MIGRNRRARRLPNWKARVAIAAAVLIGGGAIGAVAVASGSSGASTVAKSVGYSTQPQWSSEAAGLSSAFSSEKSSSSQTIIIIIARTQSSRSWSTSSWNKSTFATQRGTVVAVGNDFVGVRSSDGTVKWWGVSSGTRLIDVANSSSGAQALTGSYSSSWSSNYTPTWSGSLSSHWGDEYSSSSWLDKGDVVFIAGTQSSHGYLQAKIILFAKPSSSSSSWNSSSSGSSSSWGSSSSTGTNSAGYPQFSGSRS